MDRIRRLPESSRAELAELLGARDATLVAVLFDALLAYVEQNPALLPHSMGANLRAAQALAECIKCIDENPQVEHSLSTLNGWPAWKASAALVLERLNERPIEIEVAESVEFKDAGDGPTWRKIGKTKAKEGRPREERRDAVGVVLATAFRFANIQPTRGVRGIFGKAYRAVCRGVGLVPPGSEWNHSTLDACIRGSQRLYADIRLSGTNAAANVQMDQAMKSVKLKTPRKPGRKK